MKNFVSELSFKLKYAFFFTDPLIPLFITISYEDRKCPFSLCPLHIQSRVCVVDRVLQLHLQESPPHFLGLIISPDTPNLV